MSGLPRRVPAGLRSAAVPVEFSPPEHAGGGGVAARDAALDDLARLAAAGDRTAAGALVRHLAAPVQRLAAALVDRSSSEDLAQETFVRGLAALPSWRGEAPVRLWLLAVCRRVCADELRRRTRWRAHVVCVPVGAPTGEAAGTHGGDPASDHESYDLLRRLDADRRFAFAATQLLGLSYAETARLCGCPVGTIRSRVARAREQLIAELRAAEVG